MDKQEDKNKSPVNENCDNGVFFIPAVDALTDYFKNLLEQIEKDKKEKDDTRGN